MRSRFSRRRLVPAAAMWRDSSRVRVEEDGAIARFLRRFTLRR
jgi:hypothetical protein